MIYPAILLATVLLIGCAARVMTARIPGCNPPLVSLRAIISLIRLRARLLAVRLYDLAGIPGFVQECSYSGTTTKAEITVKYGALFTIISVNGLDIYFHRLTGSIDGVGAMPDCIQGRVPGLRPLPEMPDSAHYNARIHKLM